MFNEIYGLYYFMLEKILSEAANKPITINEINQVVEEHGFSESSLYFTPDVIAQEKGYNLLAKSPSGYASVLKSAPAKYLTSLQKSFIKTMLGDQKIRLFFEEPVLQELNKAFSDVKPLYTLEDIILTETALDCDDYSDPRYIAHFRTLLDAIRNKHNLRVCFNNSKGQRTTLKISPYKLEYGIRDDKFRLCGINIVREKCRSYVKINLSRILSITVLQQSFDVDFEAYIAARKMADPIEIEVSNLRNGFERVFIGLSNYERVSSFDQETGKCTIKIHFTADDEPELLILLLFFGPAIKVLGPADFRTKFVERIKRQAIILT